VGLRDISLYAFRNIAEAVDVPLGRRLTLVSGGNAQGKTNFLEGVALLVSGWNFRGAPDREVIRRGGSFYRLAGTWDGPPPLTLELSAGGRPLRRQRVGPFYPVVAFGPDDLAIVKGGPDQRRRFLDTLAAQGEPRYRRELARYQRALLQRNRALKQGTSAAIVHSFDPLLAEAGAYLWDRRRALLRDLEPLAREILAELAPEDPLTLEWLPGGHPPDVSESALTAQLERRANEERLRGQTLTGPHRDEIVIRVRGQPAQQDASQGQQRSIALALRLASCQWLERATGRKPVVLLDDVLSELDERRRQALLRLVAQPDQQTVVTDTASALYAALAEVHLHVQAGAVTVLRGA
jgi:DNA replication and repair protein RecF